MLTWIFTGFIFLSIAAGALRGTGPALGAGLLEGAGAGVRLGLSLAGPLCLWSGAGRLMDALGLTDSLGKRMGPLICRVFPSARTDPALLRDLSTNICANLLGLGNAATPRGISAARRLSVGDTATDELCRLVVLNTASIQLIPTGVAAIRSSLGCSSPFDILPAVWITSGLSAGLGLFCAVLLGKLCRRA